jgi:hypothetical protein
VIRGRVLAGEVVDNVIVELRRGAAIIGVVVDDGGEPVGGASVMVERAGRGAGRRLELRDDRPEWLAAADRPCAGWIDVKAVLVNGWMRPISRCRSGRGSSR